MTSLVEFLRDAGAISGAALSGNQQKKRRAIFWGHVERGVGDECWLWTGKKRNYHGVTFGVFKVNGKETMVHNIIWMLFHDGEIAEMDLVLHSCGNPLCVNYHHLYLQHFHRWDERRKASLRTHIVPVAK